MQKIPYNNVYPSSARYLIEEDVTSTPRQFERGDLRWAEGIDIVYSLRNLTPVGFRKYADSLLLLAYQEMLRYDKVAKWKFAKFDVKLGRLSKGRDLPDIASFGSAMHDDSEIAVYGPGYDVPQKHFLKDKVADILDMVKRYLGKINKQNPYRVIRLTISLREPYA